MNSLPTFIKSIQQQKYHALNPKTSKSTYIFLNLQDNTLNDIDKSYNSNTQITVNPNHPHYTLGTLSTLPLEIIHLTLLHLDIKSPITFQTLNKHARRTAHSLPQYKRILTHTPALIRATLNIQTAQYFTLQDLHNQLTTTKCDSCGDFAAYIYLLTCRRVCFLCFTQKTAYLPLSQEDVIRKFGLQSTHLAGLPHMKSFPGCYSPRGLERRRRKTLYDYSARRKTGIRVHGTVKAMEKFSAEVLSEKLKTYFLCINHKMRVTRPICRDSFDDRSSNPKRFMGIIRVPCFRIEFKPGGSLEWGFHCLACKSLHCDRPLHWGRMFTTESFRAHLAECGAVVKGRYVR
ncbi:hypothetical protein BO94DRAFT_531983 [Aspergillus sclerotioniger CBS 115572]|uniref:F-box domain-containing protein n=1 Tax=Aspergillus sclerotioniger CBS 115572 TaxID=1450535 RepID=A0A317X8U5_9EURO|nr:hypothetical protein BO94DRAFT_531983 [Aspergillus sclerotioniger CBS 115572]PWY94017.1 hypothetical protein BO94DRAFT_531983 [Aspergillus sclerotioniger CBS 115572]